MKLIGLKYKNIRLYCLTIFDKKYRFFLFYDLINLNKKNSAISIEVHENYLLENNYLIDKTVFDLDNKEYEVLENKELKLKVRIFFKDRPFTLNSHVPFYGKIYKNKIFENFVV